MANPYVMVGNSIGATIPSRISDFIRGGIRVNWIAYARMNARTVVASAAMVDACRLFRIACITLLSPKTAANREKSTPFPDFSETASTINKGAINSTEKNARISRKVSSTFICFLCMTLLK